MSDLEKAARAVLDWTPKERWAGPHDWLDEVLREQAETAYSCECGHSIGVHYAYVDGVYVVEGGCHATPPCPCQRALAAAPASPGGGEVLDAFAPIGDPR